MAGDLTAHEMTHGHGVPLTISSCSSSGSISHAHGLFQIPLDCVVKSQLTDITKIILYTRYAMVQVIVVLYTGADNMDRRLGDR
jgi:hypothetical protein